MIRGMTRQNQNPDIRQDLATLVDEPCCPDMRILLTGANGYIGRRLLPLLVQSGHTVIALVRDKRRIQIEDSLSAKVELVEADLLERSSLDHLPENIDAAYYLVHSMVGSYQQFDKMETAMAEHFAAYVSKTDCRQIIYLSGIANDEELSKHLSSRLHTETLLRQSGVPLTVLRAAIVIGSGGASFEILRDLVEKLPVMVAPRWLNTRCQPIAIRNVTDYLIGVLDREDTFDQVYDIAGPDVLTYKEMLLQFAEIRGLKRYIGTVPVLTPRLSSYWLYFVTATSFTLARSLVDSMRNEVVAKENDLADKLGITPIPYKEAIGMAFNRIQQNEVLSSWKDAFISSKVQSDLFDYVQVPVHGCFIDKKQKAFDRPAEEVLDNVWSIGGNRGWYYVNFLWKIRGYLDKMVGGVGLRRGRRSPNALIEGDALDFWRVLVANRQEGRLLLFAEMKLPGEAWLEFKVNSAGGQPSLLQTATFRPRGILGRLYWYSVLPFHSFIFEGMINAIIHYKKAD